jgi:hypothetical protein
MHNGTLQIDATFAAGSRGDERRGELNGILSHLSFLSTTIPYWIKIYLIPYVVSSNILFQFKVK